MFLQLCDDHGREVVARLFVWLSAICILAFIAVGQVITPKSDGHAASGPQVPKYISSESVQLSQAVPLIWPISTKVLFRVRSKRTRLLARWFGNRLRNRRAPSAASAYFNEKVLRFRV